eukprot:9494100-Alexandrium_andersonii.AAC.1
MPGLGNCRNAVAIAASCGNAAPGRNAKRNQDARTRWKAGLWTQGQDATRNTIARSQWGYDQNATRTQSQTQPRRN